MWSVSCGLGCVGPMCEALDRVLRQHEQLANPNVLEVLYSPLVDIAKPAADALLAIRPAFLSRLVYQTFPGGIHSGADFYINEAGIVIGETTVSQTPYDADGTPQSDRIRRAAMR